VGTLGGDSGPDLSFVGLRRSEPWIERRLADPRAWKKQARMPDLRLPPKTRKALAAWLAGRRGQDYPPGRRPWEASREDPGKTIYLKAGCVACHGAGGKGGEPNPNVIGKAIPALRETVRTYSPAELEAKIARGSRPDKADPAGPEPTAMPAWESALSASEISAVSRYLLTLKPSNPDEAW
jgi:mono/diheme cytochrome c family protein